MSRQLKQDVRLLKAAEETFMHDKGRSPRIGELAEILEKTPEEVSEIPGSEKYSVRHRQSGRRSV